MKEKKNQNGLVWLIVILIVLVLGLAVYIVYDKVLSKDKILVNNNETGTTTTTTTVKDSSEKIQKEDLILDFDSNTNINGEYLNHIDLVPYIYENDSQREKINDLIIKNIKIEGKTHQIKIKNFNPEEFYDCKKGKDKVLYFDEKVIYEPEFEACYLEGIASVIVLDDKYLVMHYEAENSGFVIILDKNGNEITLPDDIIVSSINFVNNNTIYFEGWKSGEDCYSNLYKLQIIDNKVKIDFVDSSKNTLCF